MKKVDFIEIGYDNNNYFVDVKKKEAEAYWCDCSLKFPIELINYLQEVCKNIEKIMINQGK